MNPALEVPRRVGQRYRRPASGAVMQLNPALGRAGNIDAGVGKSTLWAQRFHRDRHLTSRGDAQHNREPSCPYLVLSSGTSTEPWLSGIVDGRVLSIESLSEVASRM